MVLKDKTWRAVASLVGTTIGAGMFAIPYVTYKAGLLVGVFYILFLGAINIFINLMYGEIILRTKGDHQTVGYLKKYLGEKIAPIALFGTLFSLYGASLAYLIKLGEFFYLILGFGTPAFYTFLISVLGTVSVWFGIKLVSEIELSIAGALILMSLVIPFLGRGYFSLSEVPLWNFKNFLLPYGVVFGAFGALSIVPEMEEILREEPEKLRKAILIGSLIPIFVYLIFAIGIVGITKGLTSDDAISGLQEFLSWKVVVLGSVLGILAMGSSYLAISYALRELWFRDHSFSKPKAVLLATLPPLFLFAIGLREFVKVLDIMGAVAGGIIGILLVWSFKRAKILGEKEPAFSLSLPQPFLWFLILLFGLGMLFPFLSF